MKNKVVLVLLLLALIATSFYVFQPKSYNTVENLTFSDGAIYSGESCECFGYKDEIEKTCRGIVYSCFRVK